MFSNIKYIFYIIYSLPRASNLYLKVFWMIFFVASTSGCFYLITISLIRFFNYEVTTKIQIENPIDFPAGTICNLNLFMKSRANYFINNALSFVNVNLNIKPEEKAIGFITNILDILKVDAAANLRVAFNSSYQKEIDIDVFLISFYYSGQNFSSSDFKFIRLYDYRNCYTFIANLSNIKNISNAGPQHGQS